MHLLTVREIISEVIPGSNIKTRKQENVIDSQCVELLPGSPGAADSELWMMLLMDLTPGF